MRFIFLILSALNGEIGIAKLAMIEQDQDLEMVNHVLPDETQVESYSNSLLSYESSDDYQKVLEIINFLMKNIYNLKSIVFDKASNQEKFSPSARFFNSLSDVSTTIIPAYAIMQLVYIAGQTDEDKIISFSSVFRNYLERLNSKCSDGCVKYVWV